MPNSLPIILGGNFVTEPDYGAGQSIDIGHFRLFRYLGYAEITPTTGNAIALKNEDDLPCTIPCPLDGVALSASDPAYIHHASFYIPRVGEVQPFNGKAIAAGVTSSGATDVLKLSTAANIDLTATTTVGAVSGAAVAGIFPSGVTAGEAISINPPSPGIVVTSAIELQLRSATAAGAAGAAGGNIRVASGRVLIPVKVIYSRRLRSPSLGDIGLSAAQRELFDKLN